MKYVETHHFSFYLTLQEHFGRCTSLQQDSSLLQKFCDLKDGKTTQGATNSKEYWEYSARKLGLVDTPNRGIVLTEQTQAAAQNMASYGGGDVGGATSATKEETPVMLICADEKDMASSDYMFTLLQQVQRVHLLPEECRGNRKTLKIGLPGLACKHCCQVGRFGLSRVFPVKKRTLSSKLDDIYQHLTRCTVCPSETKELLQNQRESAGGDVDISKDQELYDLVWTRLRKGSSETTLPAVARSA